MERLTDDDVRHVIEMLERADRWAFQDQTLSSLKELLALRARVAKLKSLLEECAENFEMWHEAKNILAKIDAALKDAPQ